MKHIINRALALAFFGWLAFGITTPALAQSGGGGGGGGGSKPIVIVSIRSPSGTGHSVEATKIDVNDAGTEATVTIRDPECPEKTSTMKIDIAKSKVSSHTGDPCHDYTGWDVKGIVRIEKKKDADAVDATGG